MSGIIPQALVQVHNSLLDTLVEYQLAVVGATLMVKEESAVNWKSVPEPTKMARAIINHMSTPSEDVQLVSPETWPPQIVEWARRNE